MAGADPRIGQHYATTRLRLSGLLSGIGPDEWDRAVPACPGWRVRDVLAHLVGIIEDASAGRLQGPPDEGMTAQEVDRHRGDDPAVLLTAWASMGPSFESAISERALWPAMLDVISHEHDVRGALGMPGARDDDSVELAADMLLEWAHLPAVLQVDLGERTVATHGRGPVLGLRASAFEVLRFRLGRRSRSQVEALEWTGDPEPILDDLFVFGPAAQPIVE